MINIPGESQIQEDLTIAVFRILKSVVKFSLRYGMSIGAMSELLRRAYLEAAEDLLRENQSKVTTAQICAMTGLYRKEVRRIEALPPLSSTPTDDRYNRCSRVVTGWCRDPDFQTKAGKPAALKLEGVNGFDALVRKYSGDMTPASMKRELQRLGVLTVTSRNIAKLELRAYVPSDKTDLIQILGIDTVDLISTICHNANSEGKEKYFQRKLCYVNIPAEHVDEFFIYAKAQSQSLLEKLDIWLAKKDKQPRVADQTGSRIGVGIYHFQQDRSQITRDSAPDT